MQLMQKPRHEYKPGDVISRVVFSIASLLIANHWLCAHEGHQAVTYEVSPSWQQSPADSFLRLRITDDTGQPIAARFSMTIDGKSYVPRQLGQHGLRFVSIHKGRSQSFVATYARGTGEIMVPLPTGAGGSVTAARGFEYRAATESFKLDTDSAQCSIRLRRWTNLSDDGWQAADEHVHYERTDPQHDDDWLTMLEADGLAAAHFLVLKGGNVPEVWAQQYRYGAGGEARRGHRFIRAGEEYRDTAQGHINLLGISEVIEPISTGGIGGSPRFNFPPLRDVFRETHRRGGIGGPAHGGALAKSSTALVDTVLGEVDFFEIANSHLYKTDVWYLLMNCGFIVPPVAGTDLPNFGFRDGWQPLLGEVRTYVRVGNEGGFDAWVAGLRRGEVFVTSGPLIRLTVNGLPAGSVIQLPAQGGEVEVLAQLSSPRRLESLEVVQMGKPILYQPAQSQQDGITTYSIRKRFSIKESCWVAARGTGGPKAAIEKGLGIEQSEIAHTGAIQILVGNNPIRSTSDTEILRARLVEQQEFYRSEGRYEQAEDRLRFIRLFEDAIEKLDR
jgi:hypothetical protein